jgi:uncharacterized protein (DUF2384 family)
MLAEGSYCEGMAVSTMTPRAKAEVRQIRRAVDWAARVLELSETEIGTALKASSRSVARWREWEHRPSDRHLQAAERLLELGRALDEIFGKDMQRLHDWLHEPLPALRGRTPLRAIVGGDVEDVITVVANAESGAFV